LDPGDSAGNGGSCRKTPGPLYLEEGRTAVSVESRSWRDF
jgi:hypothetical protein